MNPRMDAGDADDEVGRFGRIYLGAASRAGWPPLSASTNKVSMLSTSATFSLMNTRTSYLVDKDNHCA